MIFEKIVVYKTEGTPSSKTIGAIDHATIGEFKDSALCTHNEKETSNCKNELWIMDEKGDKVIVVIEDVRFVAMHAHLMIFRGYLAVTAGKHKKGTKVDIRCWNKI